MMEAALERYAVNKTVIQCDPERVRAKDLPEELAETLGAASMPSEVAACALVCTGRTCLPPVTSADALRAALQS